MTSRKRWLLVSGLLLLLVVVTLRAGMPTAMSAGLRAWLEAQGASEISIGEIRLRLLDGQLELDGLRFVAGGVESRLDNAQFELVWSTSDTRRLWLKRIAIAGLRTRVAIAEDGTTRFAGLAPGTQDSTTKPGAFAVMADEASLSDGEVVVTHRGAEHRLRIDTATAGLGITGNAAAAGFRVAGSWNGIALGLHGVLASDATRRSGQVQIDAEGIRLEALAREIERLSGTALKLAGTARLKAALSVTAPANQPPRLLAATELHVAEPAYGVETGALAARSIAWLGQVEMIGEALNVRGELEIGAPNATIASQDANAPTQWSAAKLNWQGTLRKAEKAPEWLLTGDIVARDNLIRQGNAPLARIAEIRSAGKLQLRDSTPDYDGELALSGLELTTPIGPAASARAEELQWSGKVQLVDGRFAADGRLSASKVSAARADGPGSLLQIGSARAEAVQVRGEAITSRATTLADLAFLPDGEAATSRATVKRIGLTRLRYSPAALRVAELSIDGLDGRLIRAADGSWLPAGEPSDDRRASNPDATPASADGFATRIDRLRIDDASQIEFEDRSVTPPHRRLIRLARFVVDDLDSAADQPASIDLAARIDEHAEFTAAGAWKQAAGSPEADLKLTVRRLELPPMTGYASASIGQSIISGQLDADTSLSIADGKLNADNALTLRRLELKAGASTAGGQAERLDLGMPLDTALRLLRDRNGDIRLQLPVRGTISDPKFEIRDALRVATRNAMQFAAISYIKHAIQPFGTLVTLAELGAAGLNAAIRLDPLRFSPASASFDQRGLDYLQRLAAMLAERPKMQLRICGKASSIEFAESVSFRGQTPEQRADTLLQLAQARAEAVKRALIDAHGVKADRLFLCQPETGDDETLSGRVDLLV